MSDNYLKQLLSENEKPLMITRQHWLFLLGQISPELGSIILIFILVSAALIAGIGTPLIALGYILLVLPIVSLIRDWLIWFNRQFVVTNRRVIHMAGVISKHVTDSSLEKVNDVKMVQSAMGRMFDFGDIEILTASELGVNRFTHIAKPIHLKTAMLNAKARLEGDGGESQAVLDVPTLIARLGKLHEQGVLTGDEFNTKKAELLAKIK
jgi:uncharacterized membrane protein YdbT with pleckstrin-like domain